MKTAKKISISRPERKKKVIWLPKDENGNVKAGPGRPPGVVNKTTAEVKEVLSWAFDNMVDENGLTGKDRFLAWCCEHPSTFYTQMYVKMLPMTIQGRIDGNVKHDVSGNQQFLETAMVDALTRVIDTQRKLRSGEITSRGVAVVIDNDPADESIPELVLSRKAGTDST